MFEALGRFEQNHQVDLATNCTDGLATLQRMSSWLPAPVRRYVERVLPAGGGACQVVRIEQVGEMVLRPGARARRFTAREDLATGRVSFVWRATFPMLGPISLRVTDSYQVENGLLAVRLGRLPLQRNRGPEVSRGEAFRYLAELAWVPQAIVANSALEWVEVDENAVEVATRVGADRISVRLIFDEDGAIAQTVAERPRVEAENAITRWVGEYRDYRDFGGVVVPTRGEVRWELASGPFTYWRASITSFELCK